MSKSELAVNEPKSLAKGLIAGVVGGLVGVVAMTLAERMFPRSPAGENKPAGPVQDAIPWAFGAAVGAAYGALAEHYPAATAREGASFGMALEALTEEGAALGLSAQPKPASALEHASEVTSHVVYGVTTEFVRRLIRKFL